MEAIRLISGGRHLKEKPFRPFKELYPKLIERIREARSWGTVTFGKTIDDIPTHLQAIY